VRHIKTSGDRKRKQEFDSLRAREDAPVPVTQTQTQLDNENDEGERERDGDGDGEGDGNDNRQSSTTTKPSSANSFATWELRWIQTLALSGPLCLPHLVRALCPSIYGNELVKFGLLLSLFGGTKSVGAGADGNQHFDIDVGGDNFNIRSDIHCLMVGDPGLGKSQMLRYC
jgi:hypothetical protein